MNWCAKIVHIIRKANNAKTNAPLTTTPTMKYKSAKLVITSAEVASGQALKIASAVKILEYMKMAIPSKIHLLYVFKRALQIIPTECFRKVAVTRIAQTSRLVYPPLVWAAVTSS